MIRLYDRRVSGNCWKIRLMLGMAGLACERIEVDTLGGEARQPAFLALNPRGEVPVLQDTDGTLLWDSQAILAYVARKHAPDWLPLDPVGLGWTLAWLAVAGQELQRGVRQARGIRVFGLAGDATEAERVALVGLRMIDSRLATSTWLAGERPTIADLACYPYAALAPDAGIDTGPLSALQGWIQAVRRLPGYVPLDG